MTPVEGVVSRVRQVDPEAHPYLLYLLLPVGEAGTREAEPSRSPRSAPWY
jgi:hypothetical protein